MVDPDLARVFARQYGLITYEQALAAGATRAAIRAREQSGRWARLGRGVYRLVGVPVTWRQRVLAACLVSGPEAVASHRTAAAVYCVSGFRPGPVHITVPGGRSGRSALATVHRTEQVALADRARVDRLPVTTPARLIADLAGSVSGALLEEAVDDVLCRRLVSIERLGTRAEALGRRSGAPALRRILAAWTPGALPQSVAEMRIVRGLLDAGLPDPVRQHEIRDGDELVARVDLAYPRHRLAIELDSFRWHAGRRPFGSDRARRNRIEALGWHVLQATPDSGGELYKAAGALLRRVA